MHQASENAQKAAEQQWYATHSLPAAVSADCRVQVAEIVERLREIHPESGGWDAAEVIEREFGGGIQ